MVTGKAGLETCFAAIFAAAPRGWGGLIVGLSQRLA